MQIISCSLLNPKKKNHDTRPTSPTEKISAEDTQISIYNIVAKTREFWKFIKRVFSN